MMDCSFRILFAVVLMTLTGSHCEFERRFRKVIVKAVEFKIADHEYTTGEAILPRCIRRTHNDANKKSETEKIENNHSESESSVDCPGIIRVDGTSHISVITETTAQTGKDKNDKINNHAVKDKLKGHSRTKQPPKHNTGEHTLMRILKPQESQELLGKSVRNNHVHSNNIIDEANSRNKYRPTSNNNGEESEDTDSDSTIEIVLKNNTHAPDTLGGQEDTLTDTESTVDDNVLINSHDTTDESIDSDVISTNEVLHDNSEVPPISVYIVGGKYGGKERKPWQASIQFVGIDEKWHHFCGASLINSEWIVTAAHCVYDLKYFMIRIVLGDYILGRSSGMEQNVDPARMLVHGYYNQSTLQHDIALVKLATAANINNNVHSVSLATQSESFGSQDECYITGWGVTDGSTDIVSNVLRESEMTVISEVECEQDYGNVVTNTQLCVVSQDASACRGDSGGALVCRNDGVNWVQAGVASYVTSPDCEPSHPSAYTRVSSYTLWIEAVIRDYTAP